MTLHFCLIIYGSVNIGLFSIASISGVYTMRNMEL